MINNIFDTEEIIVHNGLPSEYSSIRMKEYLTACDVLEDYEVKENGDEMFFVSCINGQEHNSEGARRTIIFHSQGDNQPHYHCFHSQCRHITFDKFVQHFSKPLDPSNAIQWEQYTDTPPEKIQGPAIITDREKCTEEMKRRIFFHGYHPDSKLHVFSGSDSFQLLQMTPAELGTMNIHNLYGDEDNLALGFGVYTAKGDLKGTDYPAVGKWLLDQSKKAGVFKNDAMKPLGIHTQDDTYILNTGEYVYSEGKKYEYYDARDKFKGFYLPSSTQKITLPKEEISREELSKLPKLIEDLPFKSPQDRLIFIGVMVCGLIPGGIETRPSMWVTGKAGSGKTSVLESVLVPIWAASGAINVDVGSTSAGIEQQLKGQNVSITFDEAEADSKKGQERIMTILESAKASTTTGTGVTLKGSAGGHSVQYKHKSCYCFSSVGDQITNDTIKRRVFSVRIAQEDRHKRVWKKVKISLKRLLKKNYTNATYLYFFNRIEEFNTNINIVEDYLVDTALPSSVMAMWTSVITGYLMLTTEEPFTKTMIERHVGDILKVVEEDHTGETSENNTAVYLYDILLNSTVSTEDNKKIHILDLIRISLGKDVDTGVSITRDKAKDMLNKTGLKIDNDNNLLIHPKHDFLITLYDRRNITGYNSRLLGYPGATKGKNAIRFSTGRIRPLVLPIPEAVLSSDIEPMQEYKGKMAAEFDTEEIKIK